MFCAVYKIYIYNLYKVIQGVDDSKMGNPSSKENKYKKKHKMKIDSHKKGAYNKTFFLFLFLLYKFNINNNIYNNS